MVTIYILDVDYEAEVVILERDLKELGRS